DGTPFLSSLHDDLGALLDATLTQRGDDPSIPQALLEQITGRFDPSLGQPGQRPTSMLVLFLDPGSLGLEDPNGNNIDYDTGTGNLTDTVPGGYVDVVGNIEVLVIPTPGGTFTLNVGDLGATARGGAVVLGANGDQVMNLTDALRGGTTSFTLNVP